MNFDKALDTLINQGPIALFFGIGIYILWGQLQKYITALQSERTDRIVAMEKNHGTEIALLNARTDVCDKERGELRLKCETLQKKYEDLLTRLAKLEP